MKIFAAAALFCFFPPDIFIFKSVFLFPFSPEEVQGLMGFFFSVALISIDAFGVGSFFKEM